MSILSWLGRHDLAAADVEPQARASYTLGGSADVAQVAHLPAAVAAAFGLSEGGRVTRKDAMRRPVVRRARAVVCTTVGSQPLVAHRREPGGQVVDVTGQRPLLTQPNPNTTLAFQLTWTVDDLFFRGVSWWRVTDRDPQGYPRQAERIEPDRVFADTQRGRVSIDGQVVEDRDLIRFDGPDEGLLAYGDDVLGTSKLLDAAVRRIASGDVPLGALKLQEGAPELSTEPGSANPDDPDELRSEVEFLLDSWEDARRKRATAYLNRAVDYQTFALDARNSQLAEGRSQQRIDEANLCNVPPHMVNAPSASSMTYSTTLAERADLVDTTLGGFIVAVEQRLSMPDVTPRGTVVRFDLTRYLQGDPLSALQAAQLAHQLDALTSDEVRTDVLGRTPMTDDQRAELREQRKAAAPAPDREAPQP